MTDDVSKLPAFPARECFEMYGNDAIEYLHRDRDAYKERVDALVEELRYVRAHFGEIIATAARIDALLAACEREEGR